MINGTVFRDVGEKQFRDGFPDLRDIVEGLNNERSARKIWYLRAKRNGPAGISSGIRSPNAQLTSRPP
jgi:hypothetical protein